LRQAHSALRSDVFLSVTADNSAVYAALRISPEETLLVLCNLGSESASHVTLKLDKGLAAGAYRLTPLLGTGTFAPLTVNAQGGFDAYQPLDSLPAHGCWIIKLEKKQ
jgi:hypothetical protein